MKNFRSLLAWTALALGALAPEAVSAPKGPTYDHVLMISVDGLHAVDLSNYIATNSNSTLATLAKNGVQYPNALTTAPSDSFPGLLAPTTGGTSKSTGVFYDDSYDRLLFPPGSNCSGLPGTETVYAENLDKNFEDRVHLDELMRIDRHAVAAGQGQRQLRRIDLRQGIAERSAPGSGRSALRWCGRYSATPPRWSPMKTGGRWSLSRICLGR
jgi:hypothetical protein